MPNKFWFSSLFVLALAAVVGLALHPTVVKAGGPRLPSLYVQVQKVEFSYGGRGTAMANEEVVGFSCFADADGKPQCFIASR